MSPGPAGPDGLTSPAGLCAADVVAFWRDAGPARWFAKDEAFDAAFKARFGFGS